MMIWKKYYAFFIFVTKKMISFFGGVHNVFLCNIEFYFLCYVKFFIFG